MLEKLKRSIIRRPPVGWAPILAVLALVFGVSLAMTAEAAPRPAALGAGVAPAAFAPVFHQAQAGNAGPACRLNAGGVDDEG